MMGATKNGEMNRTIEMIEDFHNTKYSSTIEAIMHSLYIIHSTNRCSAEEILELAQIAEEKFKEKRKNLIIKLNKRFKIGILNSKKVVIECGLDEENCIKYLCERDIGVGILDYRDSKELIAERKQRGITKW